MHSPVETAALPCPWEFFCTTGTIPVYALPDATITLKGHGKSKTRDAHYLNN